LFTDNRPEKIATVPVLILISLLGVVIYSPSMHAPWYFDDFHNIVNNQIIRSSSDVLSRFFSSRGLAFASFSVNYEIGGLDVVGFHLVNVLIHILNAFVVLFILQHIYGAGSWQSIFGALLFVCHPVQTQAVSYIVQRMTSLSALFFFLSVLAYIKFRERMSKEEGGLSSRAVLLYTGSLGLGVFAVLSKENAAVLPLVLLLVEWTIISRERFRLGNVLRYVLPFMLIPIITVLHQFADANSTLSQVNSGVLYFLQPSESSALTVVSKEPDNLVLRYLFTQFVVVWSYARLLVIPVGQMLDYCYPLVNSLFNFRSIAGLAAIGVLLVWAMRQSRKRPILTLGVFWFFIALSVESTIIPLDPVFEHRLYVPLFGFVVLLLEGLQKIRSKALRKTLLVCILFAMSILTWNRNQLWADPIAFWEDNVQKAPHGFRPKVALAREILASSDETILDRAQPLLQKAIELYPQGEVAYRDLGHYFVRKKDLIQAKAAFENAFSLNATNVVNIVNLAAVCLDLQDMQGAAYWARRALAIQPGNSSAMLLLRAVQGRAELDKPQRAQ